MKRFIVPFVLLLAFLAEGRGNARPAFDQEKCSLCHIQESVFFDSSFLPPDGLKSFGEERLCGSCHNGSVQDSRVELWRGTQHPAAGPGKGRCTGCHSPHAKGGWGALAGNGASLRKGGNALCGGCHAAQSGNGGLLHGKQIGNAGCKECHVAHGGTGKALLRDTGSTLCRRCHGSIHPEKDGGHPLDGRKVRAGESAALPGCLACHPVHGKKGDTADLADRCGSCHAFGGKGKGAEIRSHSGVGKCTTCHTFHSRTGEGGRAFRGKDIRSDALCRSCHPSYNAADVRAGRAAGTHVTISREGRRDICGRCHQLHGAPAGTPLLRSRKSYFCLDCHDSQNTIRESSGISLAHPVFEKVTKGRLADVIREKKVAVGPAGEIICATCHKVHGAEKETPLLASGADKGESCSWCHPGMRGKSHGRTGGGTSPGCDGCHPVHGRKSADGDPWGLLCRKCHPRSSAHQAGIGDRVTGRAMDLPEFDPRGRTATYGAVTCPTCHDPHGDSAQPKRLRKEYRPNGFLCTTCHRSQDTVVLTPHDLRGIAGDGVCEPCHKPHAGEPPWMWGLARGAGETGEESCRACHLAGEGKGQGMPVPRGGHPTNVLPSRPLPDRFPRIGPEGRFSETGVISCSTCHAVHGRGVMPVGQGVGKLLRASDASPEQPHLPSAICAECHPGKGRRHGAADCLACHPPHRDDKAGAACLKCHPGQKGALVERHGKTGAACGSCHKLHGKDAEAGKTGERCVGCHSTTRKILKTPHAALGANACDGCHPAHKEIQVHTFRPKLGEEIFPPDLLCLRCHREGRTAPAPKWPNHPARTQEVPTNYGAKVILETPVTMVGRYKEGSRPMFPLFDAAGKPALSGTMGCLTCHDPHAGSARNDKPAANAYLRDASSVFLAEICGSCHKENTVERIRKFHVMPRVMR